MFKRPSKICITSSFNIITAFLRHEGRYASAATNTKIEQKEKWDLYGAVCVERQPVISRSMNEIETKFKQLLEQLELENSMKSDHELRSEEDKRTAELIKSGVIEADIDVVKQTAQDFEDASLDELKMFQLGSKITEADKKNDVKSLNRKLDRNLLLLVEQKFGKDSFWIPPQGVRQDGETLRQTAERVLEESCGDKLNVKFYGNAPCGFYKYKYPKAMRETGVIGAKIFYYQAKYLSGSLSSQAKYQWLDREELESTLPKPMKTNITEFLIDED